MDFFTQHVVPMLTMAEGGYVDHPSDRGGKTNHGVTEAVARRHGYKGHMRDMPLSWALALYKKKYVVDPNFHQVAALSVAVGKELVDTGVNMGTNTAAVFFQRCLNVFNAQGAHYADLKVDGDIGPATLRAFKAYLDRRGSLGETVMLRALNSLQGARYVQISETRPANEDFTFGWFAHRVRI